ncbi:GNAT family N-acetyltransferase [Thalassolituus sp. LLYu03]|uniref:GNAT family N-acetyltransferase n=1 Tax=Thalassolituus sp. LLYu03 TaxID=3421656 RepID=UPI003D2B45B9
MTSLRYAVQEAISGDQFLELLSNTSLGPRRPLHDKACIEAMAANGNLLVTAWDGEQLVGVARSMTDFVFACYLSDLAVHEAYQKRGIGRELIHLTQQQLGPHCKLILLAAPAASEYYGPLGFDKNDRCWLLERHVSVKG